MAKPRDYKKEYKYHGTAEQRANRAARNKARGEVNASRRKAGKPKLAKTQEVDHIKPLSKGGSKSKANTRVVSRRVNRRKYNK